MFVAIVGFHNSANDGEAEETTLIRYALPRSLEVDTVGTAGDLVVAFAMFWRQGGRHKSTALILHYRTRPLEEDKEDKLEKILRAGKTVVTHRRRTVVCEMKLATLQITLSTFFTEFALQVCRDKRGRGQRVRAP